MSPTFSVITPVYNGRAYIRRAWRMLQLQTFADWEWVVVDDGSTDGTSDAVRAIVDRRVRLVHYDKNRGRGYARTQALLAARGQWLAVWDVDDLYFPDRLAKADEARRAGYDFCCSYAVVVDNDLAIKGVRGFLPASGLLPRVCVHPTLACRADLARSIGYAAHCWAGEDSKMLLALPAGYRGCYYDDALTIYVEDREVTLAKAIGSNWWLWQHVGELHREGQLPGTRRAWWTFQARMVARLIALNALRLAPWLYRRTVKHRSFGQTAASWNLSPERMAFIEWLRTGRWEHEPWQSKAA